MVILFICEFYLYMSLVTHMFYLHISFIYMLVLFTHVFLFTREFIYNRVLLICAF